MGRSGIFIRALAAAIDAIALLILAVAVGVARFVLEDRGVLTAGRAVALDALLIALWLLYSSMEAVSGATAGKLLIGIVVALPDGAPAPPWTRLLRWFTKWGWLVLNLLYVVSGHLAFWYVGGTWMGLLIIGLLRMLDEDKRAWHDYWTHSAVVPRARAAAMRDLHEEPVGPPGPT